MRRRRCARIGRAHSDRRSALSRRIVHPHLRNVLNIEIRELRTSAEYAACVALQREIWGAQFTEAVPATILYVAQKVGGITAGAFDRDELVGFVFGISGVDNGELIHWSDMLAVRATYRNKGIGERLKQFQRDTLVRRGVARIHWSFDPLQAKNAHINFNRLGVYAREYVVDMYGQTSSPLHAHGTDRLIAIWDLQKPRHPVLPIEKRIAIPTNAAQITQAWRDDVRAQFLEALPHFVVVGFERGENESRYALTSASNFAA